MNTPKNNAKIILIYPSTGIDLPHVSIFLPLSILLLSAALEKEGFQTQIIDQRIQKKWRLVLDAHIQQKPLFIGISAMTGTQLHWGLLAAELVRQKDSTLPIIWGGVHASLLPSQTIKDDHVDCVITGAGEKRVVEIAHHLLHDQKHKIMGKIIQGSNSPNQKNLNLKKPELEYEGFSWQKYITPVSHGENGLAYISSRGCPHRCAYCYNGAVNKSRWTGEPAELVIKGLKKIHKLGCRGVLFFDDNFFVSQKRVEDIALWLIEEGLDMKLKADCRADYLLGYDSKFLTLIRKAGFNSLYIGAESGSNRLLRLIDKNIDVKQLLEVNQLLADKNIRPHYSFMTGLPGTTSKEIFDTVRLMLKLKEENPEAYISPAKGYVPYPGTKLFDTAVEMGFSPPDSLEAWSKYNWNGAPKPWLTNRQAIDVEKSIYITMGLDFELFKSAGVSKHKFIIYLFSQFSRLCVNRAKKKNLGATPELKLFNMWKFAKSKIKNIFRHSNFV